ncbi:MAG TPA: mechanosensitive ion channel domain-containing protein [Propionibacteriaceae bacterium]|nr:mechanosensitive ion channel domain-containing protein [Propionibacteriaceae bacterium]
MPSWFPRNLAEMFAFVPLRITFLILVALLARFLLRRLITRTAGAAVAAHPSTRPQEPLTPAVGVSRRDQRIGALGSLGGSAVTFLIFAVAVVMILSELGFNITSIVAGTSVVAVTVAFGVQNIVKDFISGVFLLIDDQVGVGDWVDMDLASGRVEEIGLRVTQLRDLDGVVWYVRNGEVLRVGNHSQGGPNGPPPAAEPEAAADQLSARE